MRYAACFLSTLWRCSFSISDRLTWRSSQHLYQSDSLLAHWQHWQWYSTDMGGCSELISASDQRHSAHSSFLQVCSLMAPWTWVWGRESSWCTFSSGLCSGAHWTGRGLWGPSCIEQGSHSWNLFQWIIWGSRGLLVLLDSDSRWWWLGLQSSWLWEGCCRGIGYLGCVCSWCREAEGGILLSSSRRFMRAAEWGMQRDRFLCPLRRRRWAWSHLACHTATPAAWFYLSFLLCIRWGCCKRWMGRGSGKGYCCPGSWTRRVCWLLRRLACHRGSCPGRGIILDTGGAALLFRRRRFIDHATTHRHLHALLLTS